MQEINWVVQVINWVVQVPGDFGKPKLLPFETEEEALALVNQKFTKGTPLEKIGIFKRAEPKIEKVPTAVLVARK